MRKEYTAIIERRSQDWYVAHCLEIPGATGEGPTEEDAQKGLEEAITLILEDRTRGSKTEQGSEGHGERIFH